MQSKRFLDEDQPRFYPVLLLEIFCIWQTHSSNSCFCGSQSDPGNASSRIIAVCKVNYKLIIICAFVFIHICSTSFILPEMLLHLPLFFCCTSYLSSLSPSPLLLPSGSMNFDPKMPFHNRPLFLTPVCSLHKCFKSQTQLYSSSSAVNF